MKRRLVTTGIAIAIDLAVGELPNRFHAVAWLGRGIGFAERRLPQMTGKERWGSGLLLTGAFVIGAGSSGVATRRVVRLLPKLVSIVGEAALLKQAFAIRALFKHTVGVERALHADDIESARSAAALMVSRDTTNLSANALASAAIESLTENASDSVVAPLLWYALLGLPGAFAYRAANTLDATVGYRCNGSFGTPSAWLDDLLNLAPARLTGVLIVAASRAPRMGAHGMLRDASKTPSPNAGWPMAAAAHALGVRLEKHGHHVLNEGGRAPGAEDIFFARKLVSRALVLSGGLLASCAIMTRRRA